MDAGIIGGTDGPAAVYLTGLPDGIGMGGLAEKALWSGSLAGAIACLVTAFLMAYFIGNISPSTILGRAAGIDIKKEGSGNAGTTNALRVLGKKAAVITLIIDILKGVAAVLIGMLAAGPAGMYGCALCVMLGHIWPMIYRFRGGKGIATSFGALLAINPLLALVELAVVAIVTLLSKRMSAGSIAGLICLPFVCIFMEPGFVWIAALISAIMIFKHRANIVRMYRGEEPKLGFLDRDRRAADKDLHEAAGENTDAETSEDINKDTGNDTDRDISENRNKEEME